MTWYTMIYVNSASGILVLLNAIGKSISAPLITYITLEVPIFQGNSDLYNRLSSISKSGIVNKLVTKMLLQLHMHPRLHLAHNLPPARTAIAWFTSASIITPFKPGTNKCFLPLSSL